MLDLDDLDGHSRFFFEEFKLAWSLFQEDKFEEANTLARRSIMAPAVNNLHKASCHMILCTHSANMSVELYKSLYTGEERPNKKQMQSKNRVIESAEAVLARTKEDGALFPHQYDDEDIEEDLCALAEAKDMKPGAEMEDMKAGTSAWQGVSEFDVGAGMQRKGVMQQESQSESLPNVLSQQQASVEDKDFPQLRTLPVSRVSFMK